MRSGFFRAGGLIATCVLLASCGGGGGGGEGEGPASLAADKSSAITFTPSSIQVVQTHGHEEDIGARIAISPEPEGSQFLAVFAVDKPLVQTRQVVLTANDDGSATFSMKTEATLAAGTHDGQLTLHICRDSQCAEEVNLTGNVLPFSIKVLPRLRLDVAGPSVSSGLGDYMVNAGDTVVVTSNIPVTWSKGSSVTGADLEVVSSTATRWEGRILGRSGLFIGLAASSVEKPANNSAQAIFNIR
jgi:hypothetical protein